MSFEQLRTSQFAIVDKTRFLWNLSNRNNLMMQIFRPDGFGKSTFLSTLQAFHDVSYRKDYERLFSGLDIDKLVQFPRKFEYLGHTDPSKPVNITEDDRLKLRRWFRGLDKFLQTSSLGDCAIDVAISRCQHMQPNQYLTMTFDFGDMKAYQKEERRLFAGVETDRFLKILNKGIKEFVKRYWEGLRNTDLRSINFDYPEQAIQNLREVEEQVHESLKKIRDEELNTPYAKAKGIFVLIDNCDPSLISYLEFSNSKRDRVRSDAASKIMDRFFSQIKATIRQPKFSFKRVVITGPELSPERRKSLHDFDDDLNTSEQFAECMGFTIKDVSQALRDTTQSELIWRRHLNAFEWIAESHMFSHDNRSNKMYSPATVFEFCQIVKENQGAEERAESLRATKPKPMLTSQPAEINRDNCFVPSIRDRVINCIHAVSMDVALLLLHLGNTETIHNAVVRIGVRSERLEYIQKKWRPDEKGFHIELLKALLNRNALNIKTHQEIDLPYQGHSSRVTLDLNFTGHGVACLVKMRFIDLSHLDLFDKQLPWQDRYNCSRKHRQLHEKIWFSGREWLQHIKFESFDQDRKGLTVKDWLDKDAASELDRLAQWKELAEKRAQGWHIMAWSWIIVSRSSVILAERDIFEKRWVAQNVFIVSSLSSLFKDPT